MLCVYIFCKRGYLNKIILHDVVFRAMINFYMRKGTTLCKRQLLIQGFHFNPVSVGGGIKPCGCMHMGQEAWSEILLLLQLSSE